MVSQECEDLKGKCTNSLFCLFHININHVEQIKCWVFVADVDADIRS